MQLAGCSTTYHNRNIQSCSLQFFGHIDHFLETWGNQTAQTDDIHMLLLCLPDNLFRRNHYPHVDNLIVITGHDDTNDVLADIMHISLDGSQKHFSGTFATFSFFCFNIWLEDAYCLFHRPGGLHHLGQEHLSLAKELSDGIHTRHERTLDDVDGMRIFLQGFLHVFFQMVANALDECLL